MGLKGQRVVDSLEKKYLALKASCPEKRDAIYRKWQALSDDGCDYSVVEGTRSSELWRLDNELSEAENAWLSERTTCLRRAALALSVPLPPDTDSDAWQKKKDTLVLTEQGDSKVRNAINKEKRERSATWRSKVAVVVPIITLILSAATFLYNWQKDTQPSMQTGNKKASAGQSSSGASPHK